jgi:hypothetical protein
MVLTLVGQRAGASRLEIKLVVIELPTDALALKTVKRWNPDGESTSSLPPY